MMYYERHLSRLNHFELKTSKILDGLLLSLNQDECVVVFPTSTDLTFEILDRLTVGGDKKTYSTKIIIASTTNSHYEAALPGGNFLEIYVSKDTETVSFHFAPEIERRHALRFGNSPVLEKYWFYGSPCFIGGHYWWFYVARCKMFDLVKEKCETTENLIYYRVFDTVQTDESRNIDFDKFNLIQFQMENRGSRQVEAHFRNKTRHYSTNRQSSTTITYTTWDVVFLVRTLSPEKEIQWQNLPKADRIIQSYFPHRFRRIFWRWCFPIIFVVILLYIVLFEQYLLCVVYLGFGLVVPSFCVEYFFGYHLGLSEEQSERLNNQKQQIVISKKSMQNLATEQPEVCQNVDKLILVEKSNDAI